MERAKKRGPDPRKAVEREFLHVGGWTLLLLKHDINTDLYEIQAREGLKNTFNEFFSPGSTADYVTRGRGRAEVISQAVAYLRQKFPDLLPPDGIATSR